MHHSDRSFFPLLILRALAGLGPVRLAPNKRHAMPAVVGGIIACIVFGKSGLNLIDPHRRGAQFCRR